MKTVEAWFFNQAEKCKEVLVPMDIGDNPGDDEFAEKVHNSCQQTTTTSLVPI